MKNQYTEKTIKKFERAFFPELKFIGIISGSTEKARSYSHIFVPGHIYGGKMGMTLCRRPWIEQHTYQRGETMRDLCPQCAKKLRRMAIVATTMAGHDLTEIASGTMDILPIDAETINDIFKEMRRQDAPVPPEAETLAMFSEEETGVKVTMTAPWGRMPAAQEISSGYT